MTEGADAEASKCLNNPDFFAVTGLERPRTSIYLTLTSVPGAVSLTSNPSNTWYPDIRP